MSVQVTRERAVVRVLVDLPERHRAFTRAAYADLAATSCGRTTVPDVVMPAAADAALDDLVAGLLVASPVALRATPEQRRFG